MLIKIVRVTSFRQRNGPSRPRRSNERQEESTVYPQHSLRFNCIFHGHNAISIFQFSVKSHRFSPPNSQSRHYRPRLPMLCTALTPSSIKVDICCHLAELCNSQTHHPFDLFCTCSVATPTTISHFVSILPTLKFTKMEAILHSQVCI